LAKPKSKRTKRKDRRIDENGVAHIQATFNNTIITITDSKGGVVSWSSAGRVGFKGSRKSTPFAASLAGEACAKEALGFGLKRVEVREGSRACPGSGDKIAPIGWPRCHGDKGCYPHPA
jgi:small subunit ribosomal protein S11